MTKRQSKKLRTGQRVSWRGYDFDLGVVVFVDLFGITVKWDNGETTSIKHYDAGPLRAWRGAH